MVNIELSDKLKLIKHQMKIIQTKYDNDEVDKTLGSEACSLLNFLNHYIIEASTNQHVPAK